jgi:hypothetical protein
MNITMPVIRKRSGSVEDVAEDWESIISPPGIKKPGGLDLRDGVTLYYPERGTEGMPMD